MKKKDKIKDDGEVGVSFGPTIGSGTEKVYPEELPSSPAISISSKPPSFLVRSADGEKEGLFDNEDVASNILPVDELPPPPGSHYEINIKPLKWSIKIYRVI